MAGESYSPNMNLVLPGVGVTAGPVYATDLNASLNIIDQHDHSAGNGVQITPNGININSDFSMNNNNLISAKSLRLYEQASVLSSGTDLGCLFRYGDDLYYNDGLGNHVRITQSGSIAGASGSISNLVSPASATFVSLSASVVFQSDTNTPAHLDGGSVLLRNLVANSKALTLSPPNSMASDYSLVLPSLPASQKIMTLDASGNMSAPYVVDNSTIEISSNTIRLKDAGITTAKLGSNLNLPGTNVQANSHRVAVSASNPSASGNMAIVAGSGVTQNGALSGDGWTAVLTARYGGGPVYLDEYTVTFTNTFLSNNPAISYSIEYASGAVDYQYSLNTGGANYPVGGMLYSYNSGGFVVRIPYGASSSVYYSVFSFIAVGVI